MEPHGLCPHLTPARATTDLCSSECYREGVCLPASACLPGCRPWILAHHRICARGTFIRSYSCVDTHAFCGDNYRLPFAPFRPCTALSVTRVQ